MTKEQENKAFAKMLKEFPKAFGRVSFRERFMLRAAFDYVVEEVIADIKANCDLAIEGRDIKIKELKQENEELKNRYDRVDIIGYDALKNLTVAKDIIRTLLFHLTDDTFYVTYETQEQSVERARQFLRGIKENDLHKENEQLKEQIEKMKCCWNCKYGENSENKLPCSSCNKNWIVRKRLKKLSDKWEIKENE